MTVGVVTVRVDAVPLPAPADAAHVENSQYFSIQHLTLCIQAAFVSSLRPTARDETSPVPGWRGRSSPASPRRRRELAARNREIRLVVGSAGIHAIADAAEARRRAVCIDRFRHHRAGRTTHRRSGARHAGSLRRLCEEHQLTGAPRTSTTSGRDRRGVERRVHRNLQRCLAGRNLRHFLHLQVLKADHRFDEIPSAPAARQGTAARCACARRPDSACGRRRRYRTLRPPRHGANSHSRRVRRTRRGERRRVRGRRTRSLQAGKSDLEASSMKYAACVVLVLAEHFTRATMRGCYDAHLEELHEKNRHRRRCPVACVAGPARRAAGRATTDAAAQRPTAN